jgi:hypothetical protein
MLLLYPGVAVVSTADYCLGVSSVAEGGSAGYCFVLKEATSRGRLL